MYHFLVNLNLFNCIISLSAGSPLAFGESTTKGRIKNVLNYKKPAFWLVCAAVVVLVVGTVLLLTNPVQLLELPDETSVIAVEMEQFNDNGNR